MWGKHVRGVAVRRGPPDRQSTINQAWEPTLYSSPIDAPRSVQRLRPRQPHAVLMEMAGVLHELGLLHNRLRPRGPARARGGRGAPVPPIGARHDAPTQARHCLQPHPRVRLWPRFPRLWRLACVCCYGIVWGLEVDRRRQSIKWGGGMGRPLDTVRLLRTSYALTSRVRRRQVSMRVPHLAAACRRCSCLLSMGADRDQRACVRWP